MLKYRVPTKHGNVLHQRRPSRFPLCLSLLIQFAILIGRGKLCKEWKLLIIAAWRLLAAGSMKMRLRNIRVESCFWESSQPSSPYCSAHLISRKWFLMEPHQHTLPITWRQGSHCGCHFQCNTSRNAIYNAMLFLPVTYMSPRQFLILLKNSESPVTAWNAILFSLSFSSKKIHRLHF